MPAMHSHYDTQLVALSLFVAVAASYVALDLAASLAGARGWWRALWLGGGATAMGSGIWSMHFIGMLAFEMDDMAMAYDGPLMGLSILVAIGASGFALAVMSRPAKGWVTVLASAVAMAGAIAGMHYIGMYSMRMAARLVWDGRLVVLSLVIALIASFAALFVAFRLPHVRRPRRLQAAASILMGLAIAGMHYTGMEAATFYPTDAAVSQASSVIASSRLTLFVTVTTLVVLALALGGAMLDRTLARRAGRERESARKAEEAEAANALKTRFIANMSHEIRTPLGAILGFAELLLEGESDEARRRQHVETILRSARALSQLVDDILDLSKIESDRLDLERRPLEVRPFLDELLALLKITADDKGIGLAPHFDPAVPRVVLTDPTRLRQVLTNLIGNAIKFTSRGGVTVRVRAPASERIEIEVEDTGIGIAANQVEHLFQPFSQADSSMTRRFGGTGLGLDISRRLARALGGDVRLARSVPRRGSTFLVTLHAPAVADSREEPARAPLASLAGARILLVEDNADNQDLITRLLERQGARVDVVPDGRAGVAAAATGRHQVILMDIQMPVMNGLEATRAIRASGARVPIIALTAHALSEERDACLASGCNAYLKKPIVFADLIQTIASFIT